VCPGGYKGFNSPPIGRAMVYVLYDKRQSIIHDISENGLEETFYKTVLHYTVTSKIITITTVTKRYRIVEYIQLLTVWLHLTI